MKEKFSLQLWQTCGNGFGIYLITKNEPILIGKVYPTREEAYNSLLDMKCTLNYTKKSYSDEMNASLIFS